MDTQKKIRDEMVLLSTKTNVKLMDKTMAILRKLVLLNWPYVKYARFFNIRVLDFGTLGQEITIFIVSKFEYFTHSAKVVDQVNRNQYIGVSHPCGMPVPFLIILYM